MKQKSFGDFLVMLFGLMLLKDSNVTDTWDMAVESPPQQSS